MARDRGPVTEAEYEALREQMEEQAAALRESLAEDLGGEPEDYNSDTYHADEPVADGGSE